MYSKVRQNATQGLWLSTLVPLLLAQSEHIELSFKMLTATLMLFVFQQDFQTCQPLILGAYGFFIAFAFFDQYSFLYSSSIVGFIFSFTISLLDMFPYSFSLGEAVLITHLLVVFLTYYPHLLSSFICYFVVERYSLNFSARVLSSFGITLLSTLGLSYYFRASFIYPGNLLLRRGSCFISLPCLTLVFGWVALVSVCILLTLHQKRASASPLPADTPKPVLSEERDEVDQLQHIIHPITPWVYPTAPFWMRKVFHFCAGVVFTSGLLVSPSLLCLASSAVLFLLLLLEWARRRGPAVLSGYLSLATRPFRDQRDSGEILFTPIALLLGLSIPLWWPTNLAKNGANQLDIGRICQEPKPAPFVWSGILSVAIGDSFAALVGRAWGKHRWWGSKRTVEGSLASWLTQMAAWCALASWYDWPLQKGFLPVTMGVLAEASTDQIDNLVIPIVVMLFFPVYRSSL